MHLEITILSEVSQKEKDRYPMISFMLNLKYDTNEHIYKTKQTHKYREQTWLLRGRGTGEGLGAW